MSVGIKYSVNLLPRPSTRFSLHSSRSLVKHGFKYTRSIPAGGRQVCLIDRVRAVEQPLPELLAPLPPRKVAHTVLQLTLCSGYPPWGYFVCVENITIASQYDRIILQVLAVIAARPVVGHAAKISRGAEMWSV